MVKQKVSDQAGCSGCGIAIDSRRKKYCDVCRRKTRNLNNKRCKDAKVAAGGCVRCLHPNDRTGKTLCSTCQKVCSEKGKERLLKLKIETLEAYGGPICACCAESEICFLTLDHTRNDGYKEKKGGKDFYMRLKKAGFPQDLGLEVSCWNCNSGRELNGGVCPHEQGGRSSFLSGLPPLQDLSGEQFCPSKDGNEQPLSDCRESRAEGVRVT